MTKRSSLSEEQQVLAAELALGLISGSERLEAERRRLDDADFDAEVRRWHAHSQSWLSTLPPQPTPEGSWRRLEAALSRGEVGERGIAVASVSGPRAVGQPGGWRIAAFAGVLAAVLFAALWLTQRAPQLASVPEAEPTMVAVTETVPTDRLSVAQISNGEGGGWLVSAAYDPADGTLYLRLSDIADEGRVPELWLIGVEGIPRSLGVADDNASQTIVLTPELQRQMVEGSTLAVSLEEPSASPRNAPAGPILGTAILAPLAAANAASDGAADGTVG